MSSANRTRLPRTGRIVAPITGNRVRAAQYLRNIFAATVPAGITPEDVQEGKFWTNVAKTLRVSDRIEVTSEDGGFYVELYVTSVVNTLVRVKLLQLVNLVEANPITEDEESELEVKHRGQILKHTVQDKATKVDIQDGFNTREEAKLWLLNYEKGLTS